MLETTASIAAPEYSPQAATAATLSRILDHFGLQSLDLVGQHARLELRHVRNRFSTQALKEGEPS